MSRLLALLIGEARASGELLRTVVRVIGSIPPHTAYQLLKHPNCPADMMADIIRNNILPSPKLSCQMLDTPKFAGDAECRAAFRESRYTNVLERLTIVSPPAEFAENIKALYRWDPAHARRLTEGEEIFSLGLQPEHLAPLLNDPDSEIRLLAICLLPNCRSAPEAPTAQLPTTRTSSSPAQAGVLLH